MINPGSLSLNDYKIYSSPQIVVSSDGRYTKHYFEGSTRFASRIVDGTDIFLNSSVRGTATKTEDKSEDAEVDFKSYLKKAGLEDEISLELENLASKKGQSRLYYLHGDHLGTAYYVTDEYGESTQFFLNLPFGETMAEQMTGVYDNPYKFNAKELDQETGFYYYGARYYNPKWSIWHGVDPLAEKMPSWSPYNYTFDNPITLIDPDGRAPSPPYRWANLNVQITWSNKMIDYDNGDGTINFRGQSGYMMANDRKNCLYVINPQYALLNDLIQDENGNYGPQTWQAIKSLDASSQQSYKSNCYGWVLTGGLYFINATTREIADFLTADGYAYMGTPSKGTNYKKGDLLLWDGHIIEATGQSKKGLLWQSKQGTNEVFEGTLPEVLYENTSWAAEQGSTSNAILFRPKSNSKDLIMNKNRNPVGTIKKVTNEDHQKIRKPD
ncbi:RHS repeat domain-containing protein [Chryseobacterium balustinum]|uniref:RHS repeat-associated core domain-containing protein n=2 Tax=Chryseobacterium balustinum TaxID=246 RepID=A0ABY1LI56_9FLAO|nr:RHS repeat-associated core domain-containing protein [Chryseobacterium balustinum]SKC14199.1 RHS repeat-associated core domain-containing protein [Chryseobacterium balustinum]